MRPFRQMKGVIVRTAWAAAAVYASLEGAIPFFLSGPFWRGPGAALLFSGDSLAFQDPPPWNLSRHNETTGGGQNGNTKRPDRTRFCNGWHVADEVDGPAADRLHQRDEAVLLDERVPRPRAAADGPWDRGDDDERCRQSTLLDTRHCRSVVLHA